MNKACLMHTSKHDQTVMLFQAFMTTVFLLCPQNLTTDRVSGVQHTPMSKHVMLLFFVIHMLSLST